MIGGSSSQYLVPSKTGFGLATVCGGNASFVDGREFASPNLLLHLLGTRYWQLIYEFKSATRSYHLCGGDADDAGADHHSGKRKRGCGGGSGRCGREIAGAF